MVGTDRTGDLVYTVRIVNYESHIVPAFLSVLDGTRAFLLFSYEFVHKQLLHAERQELSWLLCGTAGWI